MSSPAHAVVCSGTIVMITHELQVAQSKYELLKRGLAIRSLLTDRIDFKDASTEVLNLIESNPYHDYAVLMCQTFNITEQMISDRALISPCSIVTGTFTLST